MNRVSLAAAGAIGVVLAVALALLLGGGESGIVAGTASTGASAGASAVAPSDVAVASALPTDASAEPSAAATVAATPAVTLAPTTAAATRAPSRTPAPTVRATPRPTATPAIKPVVDSFSADPGFITSCSIGTTVTLTWQTTNADRVDIAVDPQGESPLQHIYLDHQPLDGSVEVPYACDPPTTDPQTGNPYHEYVVIARRGTLAVWKSIKVFIHVTT